MLKRTATDPKLKYNRVIKIAIPEQLSD